MLTLLGKDVNEVYHEALWLMRTVGRVEESRGGRVKVAPYPVVTTTLNPLRRVLFHTGRDANPFFHLMEAMWMLAGRSDVEFVAKYNPRMQEFADEGVLRGSYGARWKTHFADEGGEFVDQMKWAAGLLRHSPTTRQAVIQMWDCHEDLGSKNRDIPCNTHCYFRVMDGKLDMTVCCRSNDIIWGAYGANTVHFSFLLEWISILSGIPVGRMIQFSNNWHVYERHWHLLEKWEYDGVSPYDKMLHAVVPLVAALEKPESFEHDLAHLDELGMLDPKTRFFQIVVQPMAEAHRLYRANGPHVAHEYLTGAPSSDWADAGLAWLKRRMK